jgi:stearoyl-CoA desaturase (delta-9 desaturase)
MASVTNPSSGQKISNKQNSSKLPTKRLSEGLVPQSTVIEDEPQVSAAHPHRHVHEDGIIFDDGNSLAKRLVILGTVVIPLLGMAGAIVLAWQFGMMSWLNLVMLIGGWYLTGMGITIGYHRMLTHRSFDAVAPVRWFWTVMGALAVEGSPIDWCMVHRKHHQFSDHHGDPHSPHLHEGGFWNMLKGFWHSHTGWLFNSNWSKSEREKYVPDLVNDPNGDWWCGRSVCSSRHIGFGCFGRGTWFSLGRFGTCLSFAPHDLVDQFDLSYLWFTRLQISRRLTKQSVLRCS